MEDTTKRFSDKVENYIKYRPSYPKILIDYLFEIVGFNEDSTVADVGSGTGIFTKLLIDKVKTIYAVEPNNEMRTAALGILGNFSNCFSIHGTAENTTLDNNSIDFITSAQAFHWFNIPKAKLEFNRILKPDGKLILIWNSRINNTEFLKVYEDALKTYSTDYNQVNHQNLNYNDFQKCFSSAYTKVEFDNFQEFNFEGVIGRLLSSSYAPVEGTEHFLELEKVLFKAFEKYALNNTVRFNYKTEVYWGDV